MPGQSPSNPSSIGVLQNSDHHNREWPERVIIFSPEEDRQMGILLFGVRADIS
jgi:hypothetical protein